MKSILLPAIIITTLFTFKARAVNDDRISMAQLLSSITLSNDGFYNRVMSPAKSLNLNLSDSARTQEVNQKVANEIGNMLMVFKMTSDDAKFEKIKKTAAMIDPKLISNAGSNIQFVNGTPSAAASRMLIMIEKKTNNSKINAKKVLNSFSSYKRSAIPGMTIYEYSDARNLNQSQIKGVAGSETSWKQPLAAIEIEENKDLVLKKCRQIFGWKCVTSLYRTGDLKSDETKIQYFIAGIYNLENNPDHPSFANDKRSFNQITGSTAIYVVAESSKWVMLYGVDSQWNSGGLMFTTLIEEEYLKDSNRIKERLALDMNITRAEIK